MRNLIDHPLVLIVIVLVVLAILAVIAVVVFLAARAGRGAGRRPGPRDAGPDAQG